MSTPGSNERKLSTVDLQAKLDAMDWTDRGIGELIKLQPNDDDGRYVLMLYISGYIIAHGHTLSTRDLQALRAHAALVARGDRTAAGHARQRKSSSHHVPARSSSCPPS